MATLGKGKMPTEVDVDKKPKYPSTTFRFDKGQKGAPDVSAYKVGDTVHVMIDGEVTETGEDEYGCRLGVEMHKFSCEEKEGKGSMKDDMEKMKGMRTYK